MLCALLSAYLLELPLELLSIIVHILLFLWMAMALFSTIYLAMVLRRDSNQIRTLEDSPELQAAVDFWISELLSEEAFRIDALIIDRYRGLLLHELARSMAKAGCFHEMSCFNMYVLGHMQPHPVFLRSAKRLGAHGPQILGWLRPETEVLIYPGRVAMKREHGRRWRTIWTAPPAPISMQRHHSADSGGQIDSP